MVSSFRIGTLEGSRIDDEVQAQPMTSTQERQFPPGSTCDRYEVGRLIGAGGMGEVYEAVHEFTRKPVALKVLKLRHKAQEQLVEKMRAEAMVLCRLKHHNLVEVYDAGITDGQVIWMAMELLQGQPLRDLLARGGSIEPVRALRYAAEVADGMVAAHEAQVIHRDLKPENVFLRSDGRVCVLDFGTAKFHGFDLCPTSQFDQMGTAPYMSPEHIGGDEVDGRTDVYALGLILYEMLAGRHPFMNEHGRFPALDELVMMQITCAPEPLVDRVGPAVWDMVSRAVAKERAERFPTMGAFAAALHGLTRQLTGEHGSGAMVQTTPFPTAGGSALTPLPGGGGLVHTSQITPVPLAAGNTTVVAEPGGLGRGAIIGLALAAAALGAVVVVLLTWGSPQPKPTDEAAGAATHVEAERPAASPAEPTAAPSAPLAASASGDAGLAASAASTTGPRPGVAVGATATGVPTTPPPTTPPGPTSDEVF